MAEKPPIVLTIAGFDPSSGAGVTADIKTIAAHGCYGVACITALTVQSTAGVRRVEAVDPALLTDTLEELVADVEIAAVHIGMLASAKVVKALVDFLLARPPVKSPAGQQTRARLPNVVLDPVLKSSSGAELLDRPGIKLLIDRLIPLADVVTPNVDEAALITGLKVTDLDEMKAASTKLHEMGAAGSGHHRWAPGESHRPVELYHPARNRAGGLQSRAPAVQLDPRHRVRLRDGYGLSSCPRPGTGRSHAVGEDLR